MDGHARSKIIDPETAVGRVELCTENISVGNIILVRLKILGSRLDIKMSAFFFIEQGAKKKTAVEARQAKPFHVCFCINITQIGTIADNAEIILVYSHTVFP